MSARARIFALGLLLLAGAACAASPAPAEDLGAYRECIAGLRTSFVKLRQLVPIWALAYDRKLANLTIGIRYQQANLSAIQHTVRESWTPSRRLLLANAVQGCHSYQALYTSASRKFLTLLLCLSLLIVALPIQVWSARRAARERERELPQDRAFPLPPSIGT